MSFGPQAPCIFNDTVCAREMLGAASAAVAPAAVTAAPLRNLRRDGTGEGWTSPVGVVWFSLLTFQTSQLGQRNHGGAFARRSPPKFDAR